MIITEEKLRRIIRKKLISKNLNELVNVDDITKAASDLYGKVTGKEEQNLDFNPDLIGGDAGRLYSDLTASGINKNLAIAMLANAKAESGIKSNANGDCGKKYTTRGWKNPGIDVSKYPGIFLKPNRGMCYSFGLWQYQIGSGLGVGLLKHYGVTGSDPDSKKIPILTSYQKQVDYMVHYLRRKLGSQINDLNTVDYWVDWFVRKVERPANPDKSVIKRQAIAREMVNIAGVMTKTATDELKPQVGSGNVALVGDSQMGAGIGKALRSLFPRASVVVKPGKKPSFFIGDGETADALTGASKVILTIGGNGSKGAKAMMNFIKLRAPNAKIIWIGAPPPVTPTKSKKYVNTGSPRRELKTYYNTRAGYNRHIASAVRAGGGQFIDPYKYMSGYTSSPDGVHVPDGPGRQLIGNIQGILK